MLHSLGANCWLWPLLGAFPFFVKNYLQRPMLSMVWSIHNVSFQGGQLGVGRGCAATDTINERRRELGGVC